MTKRMLIDATHAEETRVVVLDGNRLEDFDVETQSRRQLKGNIYLAKVVRVEPSLQAAFVEYGGNRHGFLAFSEIHPDYYQIPVADRQRLLQMQEEEARAQEEAEDALLDDEPAPPGLHEEYRAAQAMGVEAEVLLGPDLAAEAEPALPAEEQPVIIPPEMAEDIDAPEAGMADIAASAPAEIAGPDADMAESDAAPPEGEERGLGTRVQEVPHEPVPPPETIGGETDGEDVRERRSAPRFLRNYKIQEVIRRRQILLVQVVKEERGTKGAALTTYISLAGRFCVLMPNSPRGGGISRKITSATDRRRLKEVTAELDIPRGMGLIVRTAGANRPKPEIKRDCEYLLRLWDDIREHTLRSVAPALIYEEASLIKRAIRDIYARDVDEVLVDGEEGWKAARDFMRMLMPTHVKKVQLWRDGGAPLFARHQVEAQLDAMLAPSVQLRSGGYLVINQTEALVAIDVNSGRSTRERGIEETALRTNLEAADEVARQLRLRDLAGLIVIDFIDMEAKKHNAAVERRMKEALKDDRARIQVGHISHFGLMEMSRQRLRPSLAETTLTSCPHCGGTGQVRSTESAALHVLRAIEDEGSKRRAAEILVHLAPGVALYILNCKRDRLADIETRYAMRVAFAADDTLLPGHTRIDRVRAQTMQELPPPIAPREEPVAELEDEDEEEVEAEGAEAEESEAAAPGETAESAERRRRRRRRRRGGRRDDQAPLPGEVVPAGDGSDQPYNDVPYNDQPYVEPAAFPVLANSFTDVRRVVEEDMTSEPAPVPGHDEAAEALEEQAPARSRGRRGGRRRRRPEEEGEQVPMPMPVAVPVWNGPTPADPFGSIPLDIFDILEQAEEQRFSAPQSLPVPEPAGYASGPAMEDPPAPLQAEAVAPVDPVDVAESGVPDQAEPEIAAAEPFVGPAVQPVVIGQDVSVPAEKKRGWWRR